MTQEEITTIVANNLVNLRKEKGLTQGELAEKFNYSDKSVSKWERGEVVPDLATLQNIADFYGVTIDYLTHKPTNDTKLLYAKSKDADNLRNRILICALWILGIWTVSSTVCGIILILHKDNVWRFWMPFIWAIPATFVALIVYAKRFKLNIHLIAYRICFSWTILLASYLEFGLHIENNVGWNLAFVFIIGIPLTFISLLLGRYNK